ncbi:MAG TPA: hypothetical protein VMG12_15230 [Polyangiaceae bacterium]|nr:hypothetical protein [Polyangiaceae bacterium]
MLRGEQRLTLRALCLPTRGRTNPRVQSAVRYESVALDESVTREEAVVRGRRTLGPSARWFGALAVAAAVWSSPGFALAQEEAAAESSEEAPSAPPSEVTTKIDAAKAQIDQLDYPGAQQSLFDVVQSGKATSAELAQAYFALGTVEAALGNDVESTDSFYLALMIEPSMLFPEGGSPKIRERLNEARSRVTEVGVLQVRGIIRDGVLDVYLDNDPLKLVRRVDVMMSREDGESGKVTLEKGAMRAEVERGVKTIQVGLYDEAGNQLKLIDVDPGSSGGSSVAAHPSLWSNWGLWAGVAGALAVGGTYFIMEAGSLDSDIQSAVDAPSPNQAEIQRLQDNQDRVGLYGVIGLSLAGAAAVTSGALLLFGGDDKTDSTEGASSDGAEARVVPTFAPGHVGASFSLRF